MIERLAVRLGSLGLTPDWLLARDAPGGLAVPGLVSANGQCRLLRAVDGWLALNLARADDWATIPALTRGDDWAAVEATAAQSPALEFRNRAIELQLPVALVGEAAPLALASLDGGRVPRRVLDLSALWAGPLCAGLLARAGAEVTRVESTGRPDPTPQSSPLLDSKLNAAKTKLTLDLREAGDRARLLPEIERADVLVTSARAPALARLGLEPPRFAGLTWVAITSHGFTGPGAGRVGFGDDCAAAGGLLDRAEDEPRFAGDALADPLTGLEAALAVLAGQSGLIDMAMARVAASYAP